MIKATFPIFSITTVLLKSFIFDLYLLVIYMPRRKIRRLVPKVTRIAEINNYYDDIQRGLIAKRNALGYLIKQSKILGDYSEEIIRNFIKSKIRNYSVSRGVIVGDEGKTSPECDIIIYNNLFYPLFNEGDVSIVRKECIRAVIEIKSIIQGETGLKPIIKHLREIRKIVTVFRYFVVVFASNLSKNQIESKLTNEFDKGVMVSVFTRFIKEKGKPIRYDVENINKGELERLLQNLQSYMR